MVIRPSRTGGQRGLTLAELLVVITVIGVVATLAIPQFMTFLEAMETRGAAQELATLLQQARELAIAQNTSYTVRIDVNGNRLCFGDNSNCTWIGPRTDSQGFMRLSSQARLVAKNADPVFKPLGNAGGGSITVQNAQGTSALKVVVSPSGRVRIDQADDQ